MSQINIIDLTFAYDGSYKDIFTNASFSLDTDWKLGFCGRNGRGKTTFLNLLLGKYEYKGKISASVSFEYFPYEVADEEPDIQSLLIQIAPEAPLWQIQKELSLLGLFDGILYQPFYTLSNGERTKVLLAGLFLRENAFLLIDEPTNHLDLKARETVANYLNKKKGYILVSHDRRFLDICTDHTLSINKNNIEVIKGNFSVWYEQKKRQDAFQVAQNEKLIKEIGRLEDAVKRTESWSDKAEKSKKGVHAKKEVKMGWAPKQGAKSKKMMARSKAIRGRQEAAIAEKTKLLKNIEGADDLKIIPLKYHTGTLLTLDGISVTYDGRIVLEEFNLNLQAGERIALQGDNGSGKSSILKIIYEEYSGFKSNQQSRSSVNLLSPHNNSLNPLTRQGISPNPLARQGDSLNLLTRQSNSPTSGRSDSKEPNLLHSSPVPYTGQVHLGSQLVISYVPQDASFLSGSLTAFTKKQGIEEHLLKALLRKLDFTREQFDVLMENFSAGQKKKVLLAGSLCQKAHLYIWDEPLNYIDVLSRIQIENLIQTYQPTLLFVEHDQAFTEHIATKVITL